MTSSDEIAINVSQSSAIILVEFKNLLHNADKFGIDTEELEECVNSFQQIVEPIIRKSSNSDEILDNMFTAVAEMWKLRNSILNDDKDKEDIPGRLIDLLEELDA